ncbi:MAG: hypothetical protein AAB617_02205 [Patescibacteria group bacterium]
MNTKNTLKRLLSTTILMTMLGINMPYNVPKAVAAPNPSAVANGLSCLSAITGIGRPSAGGLIGSEVPIKNKQGDKDACKTFVNRLSDLAVVTARQVLKKRILDTMVDQTIGWINGNGDPKFVTDYKQFLKDAGNAAVGDVAKEIGLGAICAPFKLRLQLDLQAPGPFTQQVSCTLDSIVGNIENFYDDFKEGEWIGYNEILKPQNNYYGAFLLAQDETLKRSAEATRSKELEASAGSGFLSTKQCLEWTVYGNSVEEDEPEAHKVSVNTGSFNYPDPSTKPPNTAAPQYTGYMTSVSWECTKQRIGTPGQILSGATQKAVNAHTDYIINADDLAEYAAAIVDAGINRLVKEGVKGLSNINTNNTPPGGYNSTNLPPAVNDPAGEYDNSRTNQQLSAEINDFRNDLNEASSSLGTARTNLTSVLDFNNQLATSTQDLINWCGANGGISLHPFACSNLSSVLSGTTLRASTTLLQSDSVEGLVSLLSGFRSQTTVITVSNLSSLLNAFPALRDQINLAASAAESLLSETQNLLTRIQTTLSDCLVGGGNCGTP